MDLMTACKASTQVTLERHQPPAQDLAQPVQGPDDSLLKSLHLAPRELNMVARSMEDALQDIGSMCHPDHLLQEEERPREETTDPGQRDPNPRASIQLLAPDFSSWNRG